MQTNTSFTLTSFSVMKEAMTVNEIKLNNYGKEKLANTLDYA